MIPHLGCDSSISIKGEHCIISPLSCLSKLKSFYSNFSIVFYKFYGIMPLMNHQLFDKKSMMHVTKWERHLSYPICLTVKPCSRLAGKAVRSGHGFEEEEDLTK